MRLKACQAQEGDSVPLGPTPAATSLTLSLFPPSPGPLYPLQRDQQGPGVLDRVERLKQGLLAKVRTLGRELPVNTLDQLIHQLGGPECVAEVSHHRDGRGGA